MKVERVSYDVPTPTAMRGLFEAIYWKPAIRWVIDRIHVLRSIRFESIRRNEVGHNASAVLAERAMRAGTTRGLRLLVEEDRQQRASAVLRDVAYVIEAHFEMTPKAGPDDNVGKHLSTFNRRARAGQCFHQPCLGCREFPASFALIEPDEALPRRAAEDEEALKGIRDLGWMLLDIDYANGNISRFFRAEMINGVVEIPRMAVGGTIA